MRYHAAIILGVAVVLCGSRAAAQDETRWVPVFVDSAEVVAIDTASVTPLSNDIYRVWERSVARASGKVRVVARADFDCRLRLTRAVAVALPGFAPTRAFGEESEWTEILPGTRFEAELRHACAIGRRAAGRPAP